MLPLEDPCFECLIKPICNQMCPKVIEYYKQRVRIRSKQEVQDSTGYYWEDDYTDDKGVVHPGQAQHKLREKEKEDIVIHHEEKPNNKEKRNFKKCLNLLLKILKPQFLKRTKMSLQNLKTKIQQQ